MAQQRIIELQQVMSRSASVQLDDASKLSKESGNYSIWKTSVMNIFRCYGAGLPEYVEHGQITLAAGEEGYRPTMQSLMDAIISHVLQHTVQASLYQCCVTSQLLGRAAWIYLQQLCTNLCEFDVYKLAADLFDIEQKPGESPVDFFTRMNTACLCLSNFVDDKDFVTLWMASKAGLSDEKARFVFNDVTFPRGVDHYVLQDKLIPFMKTPGAQVKHVLI
jgi:hypothetical protein